MWAGGRGSGPLWAQALGGGPQAPQHTPGGPRVAVPAVTPVKLETSPEEAAGQPHCRDSVKGPVIPQSISSWESRNGHSRWKDIKWP